MQHPDEGTIHSWLDGALSAEEAALVEEHVKDCPQCAAAVAEARGFIAASSRILTALDNAPRGVIPVAAAKKRLDPIVWRIAATLLVVAGGTFVVLKTGGKSAPEFSKYEQIDSAESVERAESAAVAKAAASPITIIANSARPAGGGSQANTLSGTRPPAKVDASGSATARQNARAAVGGAAQNEFSGRGVAKMGAADRSTATGNPAAVATPVPNLAPAAAPPSQANGAAALYGRLAPRSAKTSDAGVASPQTLASAPAAGVASTLAAAPAGSIAALDAVSEPKALKKVGTARQIGVTTTLYEVAPGDTVTLIETLGAQLESVVVTGMSATRTADQPTEKSAARAAEKRAAAPAVSASDSQGAAGTVSQAPAQAVQARVTSAPSSRTGNVQVSNGVTTIIWTDPVTSNVMKLSGRLSAARLQQVKTQIERERAAEAAKKKP